LQLAALSPQDVVVVVIFVVIPLAQRLFQHLQKKRAEAESKERMRHRREGTLPTAEPKPARPSLLERLEELGGQARGPAASTRARSRHVLGRADRRLGP
jgi:hypothetical protein